MEREKVKIGERLYHCCFGWCKVTHPPTDDGKTLVDLEADEIEYYTIGKGYNAYKRPKKGEAHVLFTPVSHLYKTEQLAQSDKVAMLRRAATNPKLTFWEN
jgi:hypothetical protein